MTALMKVTTFDNTFDRVDVTADCTPPTSLVIRLCRSPVRDELQNESNKFCKWAYKRSRSSRRTSCPSRLVNTVCTTPRPVDRT